MDQADDSSGMLAALKDLGLPNHTFVWVGAKVLVAKAVRQHLLDEHKIPAQWIKAFGRWMKEQADVSIKYVGDVR